jgi:hypothetical protein
MNFATQTRFGWKSETVYLASRTLRVDPKIFTGLRDVRCPLPFRITVKFHPEAGFFPSMQSV